jgi:hypothetical protein
MKNPLALLVALCLGVILVSGTASAAALISTNTQTLTFGAVPSVGYDFNFSKFDQSLGTLTDVIFTIVSSSDQGAFTASNSTANSIKVYNPSDSLTVTAAQGGLISGNSTYYGDGATLTTTPGTGNSQATGATLASHQTGNYTLSPQSIIPSSIVCNIDPSYFSLYQSWNGSGSVSFNAANNPQVSMTGGVASFDMSGVTNSTTLSLVYKYTAAVPEPSAYALFGIGALALVVACRRRSV